MALLLLRQRRRRQAILPPMRDRLNPLDYMQEEELIKKYRFDRNGIFELCQILHFDLNYPTRRHNALPTSLQICIALRYYASGSFLPVLADSHGVGISTVSRFLHAVSYHLARRGPLLIRFPRTVNDLKEIKQGFYSIANFPRVLGSVDGTFIPIKAPSEDEHLHVTRKGFHAINVQGICDATNKFLNLVVRWPGSKHDAFILMNSHIADIFETGQVQNGWLLGDSAYPLKPWLLTPVSDPRNPPESRYNVAHKRTWCVIERTYGIWKMRF